MKYLLAIWACSSRFLSASSFALLLSLMRFVLGACIWWRNPKLVPHATVTPLERPERLDIGRWVVRGILGGRKEGKDGDGSVGLKHVHMLPVNQLSVTQHVTLRKYGNALKLNLEYRMWKDVFVASSSAWHCVLAIFECTTNKNTNHIYNVINLC